MIDLLDIAPEFAFLADYGFIQEPLYFREEEFGNAALIMRSALFSLKFERDRGQVVADIGGDDTGWIKLEYAIEFVNREVSQDQLGEPPEMSRMAQLLQANWRNVQDLFSNTCLLTEAKEFGKVKSSQMLSAIFRRPF